MAEFERLHEALGEQTGMVERWRNREASARKRARRAAAERDRWKVVAAKLAYMVVGDTDADGNKVDEVGREHMASVLLAQCVEREVSEGVGHSQTDRAPSDSAQSDDALCDPHTDPTMSGLWPESRGL